MQKRICFESLQWFKQIYFLKNWSNQWSLIKKHLICQARKLITFVKFPTCLVLWLSACLFLNLYLVFESDSLSENAFLLLGHLVVGYKVLEMLHKLILKKSVFIVNGEQLYYSKIDQWFDLNKVTIYEKSTGKYNF